MNRKEFINSIGKVLTGLAAFPFFCKLPSSEAQAVALAPLNLKAEKIERVDNLRINLEVEDIHNFVESAYYDTNFNLIRVNAKRTKPLEYIRFAHYGDRLCIFELDIGYLTPITLFNLSYELPPSGHVGLEICYASN